MFRILARLGIWACCSRPREDIVEALRPRPLIWRCWMPQKVNCAARQGMIGGSKALQSPSLPLLPRDRWGRSHMVPLPFVTKTHLINQLFITAPYHRALWGEGLPSKTVIEPLSKPHKSIFWLSDSNSTCPFTTGGVLEMVFLLLFVVFHVSNCSETCSA